MLGSVEALRGDETVALGGRRQRALLALLLVEAGRPLSADSLVEELWHGQPPAGASITLPSYVSRLRAALGPEIAIQNTASGYILEVSPDQVDAIRFERLVREGVEALARGAARRAAERLRAGLALWHGAPFGDVGDDGALRLEADRLEELHIVALEERIEADLALGVSVSLVPELEALVREHPYRERFWGQLMLALYRAQRQADALATYRRLRGILDDELGLEPSPELQALEQAILLHEVAVVLPADERHNLPVAVTSFIGREIQLAEIDRHLGDARLVTLTGIGGVGKTRLALEAATRALPDFSDGVCFVDLSGLTETRLVGRHVLLALEVREDDPSKVAGLLHARLRDASLLLVLDNCEHLREACAELAQALLSSSVGLRILATSREVLGAPGEIDYPVASLMLPSSGADPEALRTSEAVRLFLARARAARPRLPDDDRSAATAARICSELDGLPLAIELAAARAKALSLEDIAGRLSDRFRFLVSSRRLSSARHRTLREAMDWSYELLSPDEQMLLTRLAVFAGDFTLDAVATVCLDGDGDRAYALVERLVGTSLVTADEQRGEMRYRLLETVRQYAAGRLDGETAEQTRRAHAQYFLAVAEGADLTAVPRRAQQRLDVAIAAQDNLRSALAWSVDSGSVAFGLELATSLERFWVTRDAREGMRWFAALLDLPGAVEVAPIVRANALRAYGGAAEVAGLHDVAEALWQQSLDLFEQLGDEHGQAVLLHRLGISAMRRGDLDRARELVERSHGTHEQNDDAWGQAQTVGTLGAIARDAGDAQGAVAFMEASAGLAHDAGFPWWESGMLAELANLSLDAGRIDEGERRARASLALAEQMGDRPGRVFGIGLLARVAAVQGQHERATRLWAAVEHEDAGAPLGGWRHHRDAYEVLMRVHLLPEAGTTDDRPRLTLDEAASLALEPSTARAGDPVRPA